MAVANKQATPTFVAEQAYRSMGRQEFNDQMI